MASYYVTQVSDDFATKLRSKAGIYFLYCVRHWNLLKVPDILLKKTQVVYNVLRLIDFKIHPTSAQFTELYARE